MHAPSTPTVTTLLQWCEENNIWIDPRVEIRLGEDGIAVYSKDEYIPTNTTLSLIHRNSVLSVRSCSLSNEIQPVLSGTLAVLSLSLALYGEILKGETSRWYGYLQSLPNHTIPLPIFWNQYSLNEGQDKDGVDALQWLKGTEADRNLASASTIHLEDLDSYFDNVAGPLLRRHSYNPNRGEFYRAFSFVSSRAFLVDAYHGLSMVPIADAFNHSQDNHVHIQTEFSVCSQCGSLYECPHDNSDAKDEALRLSQRSSTRKPDPGTEFDSYYEMVLNAAVVPNEEIFNTYGETLSNAQLLNRYGFILDVNENDRISWTFEEVIICFAPDCWPPFSQFQLEAVVYTVAREKITERILKCNLVFYPQDEDGSSLCLDVDGRISLQLWILLALPLCLQRFDGEPHNQADYLAENLVALLNYQLFMEGTDDGHHVMKSSDEEAMVASLAHSIIGLCRARRAQLGKTETGDPNIILDDLPEAMHLTRKAMTLMISEQSVLDSCISAWEPYVLIDE